MSDIVNFVDGEDGVFAHVVGVDGKHSLVCMNTLGEEGSLIREFGEAVAARVQALKKDSFKDNEKEMQ